MVTATTWAGAVAAGAAGAGEVAVCARTGPGTMARSPKHPNPIAPHTARFVKPVF